MAPDADDHTMATGQELPLGPVFCRVCGHRNDGSANFCSACGNTLDHELDDETTGMQTLADLGEADSDLAATLGDVPGGTSLLVVTRGPNAGERFTLDGELLRAGRHPDSDIFLDDVTVSRRHVEIVRDGGYGFAVRDAGSLNGTYLNRVRIEQAVLNDGDELQIGKFRLVFVAGMGRES